MQATKHIQIQCFPGTFRKHNQDIMPENCRNTGDTSYACLRIIIRISPFLTN